MSLALATTTISRTPNFIPNFGILSPIAGESKSRQNFIPNFGMKFLHMLEKYRRQRKVTRTDVFKCGGISNHIYYNNPTKIRKISVVL